VTAVSFVPLAILAVTLVAFALMVRAKRRSQRSHDNR